MRYLFIAFLVALAACSTATSRSPSAAIVAQSFAEYYATLIPAGIEVVHVVAETSEAAAIAHRLATISRTFVVKTDGKYLETKSEVIDVATRKRSLVLRLGLEIVDDRSAAVTVSCTDGSWTMMTYFLSFDKGAWKVTGSKFIAAS